MSKNSRRQFLSTVTATGATLILRPGTGRAADVIDPRVDDIVAKTIGIDTHNHVDVPLTEAEMPGPDLALIRRDEAVWPVRHLHDFCDRLPAGRRL